MKIASPMTIAVSISAWGNGLDILSVIWQAFVNGILLCVNVPQQSINLFISWRILAWKWFTMEKINWDVKLFLLYDFCMSKTL